MSYNYATVAALCFTIQGFCFQIAYFKSTCTTVLCGTPAPVAQGNGRCKLPMNIVAELGLDQAFTTLARFFWYRKIALIAFGFSTRESLGTCLDQAFL